MDTDGVDKNHLCVKCGMESDGILQCQGCQHSFCWNHIEEHRRELSHQVEIVEQHINVLQHDLNQESKKQSILAEIDQWEKESIAKIQMAAETARINLCAILRSSTDGLETSLREITRELYSNRESNNFCEITLTRWSERLKKIRQQIETLPNIRVGNDEETSAIRMIQIREEIKTNLETSKFVDRSFIVVHERFDQVICGDATLVDQGHVVINSSLSWSSIHGANFYSTGRYCLHFRIEQGWGVIFGIITSTEQMRGFVDELPSAYGWWRGGSTIEKGRTSSSDGNVIWREGDEVTLTLDCDNRQIIFDNKQINIHEIIEIDLQACPTPWQLALFIYYSKVRIVI